MTVLRFRTLDAQLENDQLDERVGDDIEKQYRRGHNAAVRRSLDSVRLGETPETFFVSESAAYDDLLRAYCRGRNAGMRHVRAVLAADQERREREECEAADALARTNPIEFGLRELVENTPPRGDQ